MARRWTDREQNVKKQEMAFLYVAKNKTIAEIGNILGISQSGVYNRIIRLGIPSLRNKKIGFNNLNTDIKVPKLMSTKLAEFMGILLGDGHLTPTQITVTLGTKEHQYALYVCKLMKELFGVKPKIAISQQQCQTVYLGSTVLVRWLLKDWHLVYNKVKHQVDIPAKCFTKETFMRAVLRGLFDTDGSIYLLRRGMQMSLTNKSQPILRSGKIILEKLGFHPSSISHNKIYLTRKADIKKYLSEIGFANKRHLRRFKTFQFKLGRFV